MTDYLATSFLYSTNPTKFSSPPSARLLNSGNFFLSIFFVYVPDSHQPDLLAREEMMKDSR